MSTITTTRWDHRYLRLLHHHNYCRCHLIHHSCCPFHRDDSPEGWSHQGSRILTCNHLMPPDPYNQIVEGHLRRTGFYHISQIRVIQCQSAMVNALVESWHPKTHTFYFSVGACVVTLEDIPIILVLSTNSLPVIEPNLSSYEALEVECLHQFGITPRKTDCRGSFIKWTWFQGQKDRIVLSDDIHIQRASRVDCKKIDAIFSVASHLSSSVTNVAASVSVPAASSVSDHHCRPPSAATPPSLPPCLALADQRIFVPAPASLLPATLEPHSAPSLLSSLSTTLTYRGYLLLITEPVPPMGHCASRYHHGPLCEPKPRRALSLFLSLLPSVLNHRTLIHFSFSSSSFLFENQRPPNHHHSPAIITVCTSIR
ncbi:hypothetical protein Ahy_B04g071239 [Arachis hypogaea]|uniref:Aminotransferase-like plant mobile domain-containing protein n=1 Tax=Arachis hypogaea TaxID=3818 RepID=A0A444ZKA6_ARAHY|nr:hypothetical protein Ahy_B04g071239 [Arachis hypogaea]